MSTNYEIRDLVIGFDLGSSSTKVIIHDPSFDKAYAIPFFNYASNYNPYILPTGLTKNENNKISLLSTNDYDYVKHLKLNLLNKNFKYRLPASIYIGLVLRQVKSYFIKTYHDIYKDLSIRWHLNLGIPAENYDDEDLVNIYYNIAIVAWYISNHNIHFNTFDKFLDYITNKSFDLGINKELINVVPEVIAEVASFEKSSMRQDGLHLLIDVGATTLDITSFIIYRPSSTTRFTLPCANIRQLGANILHDERLNSLSDIINYDFNDYINTNDPCSIIPDNLDEYINLIQNKFHNSNRLHKFLKSTTDSICSVLNQSKQKFPYFSSWSSDFNFFLSGGGCKIFTFKDYAINDSISRLQHAGIINSVKILFLPIPQNLQAEFLPDYEYHRLAVAYGLSFPIYEIGDIYPSTPVVNDKPKPQSNYYTNKYISKDMV